MRFLREIPESVRVCAHASGFFLNVWKGFQWFLWKGQSAYAKPSQPLRVSFSNMSVGMWLHVYCNMCVYFWYFVSVVGMTSISSNKCCMVVFPSSSNFMLNILVGTAGLSSPYKYKLRNNSVWKQVHTTESVTCVAHQFWQQKNLVGDYFLTLP